MMRIGIAAALFALALLPRAGWAECGDVSGDGVVTSVDALRTLKKAVGQPVNLTCAVPPPDPVVNALAFTNMVTCNSADPHATLTWSEHPSLGWKTNLATKFPLLSSAFQRVDDSSMQGTLTVALGSCGTVQYDLDANQLAYPLPSYAGVTVVTSYQASDNTVYLGMFISPNDTSASLVYGEGAPPPMLVLGSVPAPLGVSGAEVLQ